jgi:hypothetical protein
MEKSIKSELEGLFVAEKERTIRSRLEVDERHVREAAVLQHFNRLRDTMIKAAMLEVADFLNRQGCPCEIKAGAGDLMGESKISMVFYLRHGISQGHYETHAAYFSVRCDKAADAAAFFTTPPGTQNGTLQADGSVRLGSLTKDIVQSRLVGYVRKLMGETRSLAG